MSDFIAALTAEIASLERELKMHPAYAKLREAKRLLAVYTGTHTPEAAQTPPAPPRPSRPSASGISAEIISAVREHLAGRLHPTPTRALMDVLAQKGVEVSGSVPQNVVSSLLSKSPEFISHGRTGWTLATKSTGDTNPAKDTSPVVIERQDDFLTEPSAKGREAVPGGGT